MRVANVVPVHKKGSKEKQRGFVDFVVGCRFWGCLYVVREYVCHSVVKCLQCTVQGHITLPHYDR